MPIDQSFRPEAGKKAATPSAKMEMRQRRVESWRKSKSLFMRQALGYRTIKPFQVNMVNHHGKLNLGRYISLVLCPRDSGKSWASTIGDGVYEICHNPNLRGQIVAEAQDTAVMFLSEIKQHLEDNPNIETYYGKHKPDTRSDRSWATRKIVSAQRTKIMKEPTMEALGATGAIVGRHVDIQWLDDIVSDRTSDKPEKREALLTWYDKILLPVLEQGGEQRIRGTRYFHDDLYDQLIKRYGENILYRVKALHELPVTTANYEPRESDFMPLRYSRSQDGSHFIDLACQTGDICRSYFPERYKAYDLWLMRKANPFTFAYQYQNDPTLGLSQFLEDGSIRLIDVGKWPDFGECSFYIGVDPAQGTEADSDYFATATVAYHPKSGRRYVLRVTAEKLGDPFKMMQRIYDEWMWVRSLGGYVTAVGIESNAFQGVLVKAFNSDPEQFGLLPITEMDTKKDKVQRFIEQVHWWNLGHVFVDEENTKFIEDVAKFPDIRRKDRVDAVMLAFQLIDETSWGGAASDIDIQQLTLNREAAINVGVRMDSMMLDWDEPEVVF